LADLGQNDIHIAKIADVDSDREGDFSRTGETGMIEIIMDDQGASTHKKEERRKKEFGNGTRHLLTPLKTTGSTFLITLPFGALPDHPLEAFPEYSINN
jgi:hypothetical protein